MTLEQLRIFIAVAEREHVTQAAAWLNLTQSATSAAIAVKVARSARLVCMPASVVHHRDYTAASART